MKKKLLAGLIVVFLLLCGSSTAQNEKGPMILNKPSKEIKLIINQLRYKPWEGPSWMLVVSGLDVASREYTPGRDTNFKKKFTGSDYEYYKIPHPKNTPDAFSYSVIYDKKNRRFWIEEVGGIAFTHTIYGPGYLDKSGKIVQNKEQGKE